MAALALLHPAEPDLSLPLSHSQSQLQSQSQHPLDISPQLLSENYHHHQEEEPEPLMMAQPVPHQTTTDKKRVKVYELRNNDWFDRGTGFCTACFVAVCPSAEFFCILRQRV